MRIARVAGTPHRAGNHLLVQSRAASDPDEAGVPVESFDRGGPPPAPKLPPVDLGRLLDGTLLQPARPEQLATWHLQARDRHTLQEVRRGPEGRLLGRVDALGALHDGRRVPGSYLSALDPRDGTSWTWCPEVGDRITREDMACDGSTLVAVERQGSYDRGRLVRLDPGGHAEWTYEAPSRQTVDSFRTGSDGRVFVKCGRRVAALDGEGRELWARDLGIEPSASVHLATPAGRQIFVDSRFTNPFSPGGFAGLEPDGSPVPLDLPPIGTFPLEAGTRLLYGGKSGQIRCVDLASGRQWEAETGSRSLSTPWEGRDGRIYVQGRTDHRIHALEPDGRKAWSRTVEDVRPAGVRNPFEAGTDGCV